MKESESKWDRQIMRERDYNKVAIKRDGYGDGKNGKESVKERRRERWLKERDMMKGSETNKREGKMDVREIKRDG